MPLTNPQHCMIDIESWGTRPGSAITSIGAFKFSPYWPHPIPPPLQAPLPLRFEIHVDVNSSVQHGLTLDPSTILWWLTQSEAARTHLATSQAKAFSLTQALLAFNAWMRGDPPATYLWAHGATFDPVLLTEAYRATRHADGEGLNPPFEFRNVRDTRTAIHLAQDAAASRNLPHPIWPDRTADTAPHTALGDAWAQAEYIRRCVRMLLCGEVSPGQEIPTADPTLADVTPVEVSS